MLGFGSAHETGDGGEDVVDFILFRVLSEAVLDWGFRGERIGGGLMCWVVVSRVGEDLGDVDGSGWVGFV